MSKQNKIAQCELFFKELVKQKNSVYETGLIVFQEKGYSRNMGYINGLEFAIERLGKILDMAEDDPCVERY